MSLGQRQTLQPELFMTHSQLSQALGHPFYAALERMLHSHGFDRFVESLCAPVYALTMGRPSIPPGVYFRCLFVGYFEGIRSERGIAWRCSDSLSLRSFLTLLTYPWAQQATEVSAKKSAHRVIVGGTRCAAQPCSFLALGVERAVMEDLRFEDQLHKFT